MVLGQHSRASEAISSREISEPRPSADVAAKRQRWQ